MGLVLPIVQNLTRSRRWGVFWAVISCFPGSLIWAYVFAEVSGSVTSTSSGWMAIYDTVLILAILILLWIGPFLAALVYLITTGDLTVGGEEVTYNLTRGLWGRRFWSEPLSTYTGVLYDYQRYGGTVGETSSDSVLTIELLHDDPIRTVILEKRENYFKHSSEMRQMWEEYAKLLNLPALRRTEDGIEARELEQLDVSAAELVQDGLVRYELESEAIPKEIDVVGSQDVLVLGLNYRTVSIWKTLGGLAFAVAISLIGAIFGGGVIVFVVGGLFLLAPLVEYLADRVTHYRLMVSPVFVKLAISMPWISDKVLRHLSATDIEEVNVVDRVINGKTQGAPAIHIEGDSGEIVVGTGLPVETLEWIKGCVLEVLARGRKRG